MAVEIYIDGASRGNPGDASSGVGIKKDGKVAAEIGAFIGKTTNNMAEYISLIRGLEEALTRGYKKASFFSDSELLVKQLNGEYRVKNESLIPLHYHILSLVDRMDNFSIKHVTRDKNEHADKLANEALDVHLKANMPLFNKSK